MGTGLQTFRSKRQDRFELCGPTSQITAIDPSLGALHSTPKVTQNHRHPTIALYPGFYLCPNVAHAPEPSIFFLSSSSLCHPTLSPNTHCSLTTPPSPPLLLLHHPSTTIPPSPPRHHHPSITTTPPAPSSPLRHHHSSCPITTPPSPLHHHHSSFIFTAPLSLFHHYCSIITASPTPSSPHPVSCQVL